MMKVDRWCIRALSPDGRAMIRGGQNRGPI